MMWRTLLRTVWDDISEVGLPLVAMVCVVVLALAAAIATSSLITHVDYRMPPGHRLIAYGADYSGAWATARVSETAVAVHRIGNDGMPCRTVVIHTGEEPR